VPVLPFHTTKLDIISQEAVPARLMAVPYFPLPLRPDEPGSAAGIVSK
jgi:hypothetical protein